MSLQDALRKAASLLIESTPEEPALNSSGETLEEFLEKSKEDPLAARVADSRNADSRDTGSRNLDVNALLAEQGIGPGAKKPAGSAGAGTKPASAAPQGASSSVAPSASKTVEQIVRDADGPNLDEIKIGKDGAAGDGAGAPVEPTAIYTAAKLPASPFTAEQMLEMLAGLPSELPLDTKRQTVKVTLGALGKTMGATPETIVADASRKMAALAAYSEHLSRRTDEFAAKNEAEIAALQTQIEEKRKAVLNARQRHTQTVQMCQAESERLDDVLEFFSLDVAPSKYAPESAPGKSASPAPAAPTPPR